MKELLRLTVTPVLVLGPGLPLVVVDETPVLVESDAFEGVVLLLFNCEAEGEGEREGDADVVMGANEVEPPLPLPALPCVLIMGEPVDVKVEVPEKPSRFSTGILAIDEVLAGAGALKSGGNREDMMFIIQSSKDMGR